MSSRKSKPELRPAAEANQVQTAAATVDERLSEVREPLRIEPDDVRSVVLEVPVAHSTGIQPKTTLLISRNTARILARATDGAMREGWTCRGRPLESIDDFVSAIAEHLMDRQQPDGNLR